MAVVLERPESQRIKVLILPSDQQPQLPTILEAGGNPVYLLKGTAGLPDQPNLPPKNVVFLFPAKGSTVRPEHVRERLGNEEVDAHRLALDEDTGEIYVAPTSNSLDDFNKTRAVEAAQAGLAAEEDGTVVSVPGYLRRTAIRDLTRGTNHWFTDWMERFSMRVFLEKMDPYDLIQPDVHSDPSLNQRAITRVENILTTAPEVSLDPIISANLRDKIITPGQAYEQWLDTLKAKNKVVYRKYADPWNPRLRHQALFDLVRYHQADIGKLDQVLTGNPYELHDSKQKFDAGSIENKYQRATAFLNAQARRFGQGPEHSLFQKLSIITQLARENAFVFGGKEEGGSEMLREMLYLELNGEMPYLSRLLRALEITDEGQEYSAYLRTRFVEDPGTEALRPAA